MVMADADGWDFPSNDGQRAGGRVIGKLRRSP
jgi:hypothetical protein